jgi:hypothetical protein
MRTGWVSLGGAGDVEVRTGLVTRGPLVIISHLMTERRDSPAELELYHTPQGGIGRYAFGESLLR